MLFIVSSFLFYFENYDNVSTVFSTYLLSLYLFPGPLLCGFFCWFFLFYLFLYLTSFLFYCEGWWRTKCIWFQKKRLVHATRSAGPQPQVGQWQRWRVCLVSDILSIMYNISWPPNSFGFIITVTQWVILQADFLCFNVQSILAWNAYYHVGLKNRRLGDGCLTELKTPSVTQMVFLFFTFYYGWQTSRKWQTTYIKRHTTDIRRLAMVI
jgi:hypothetical protein